MSDTRQNLARNLADSFYHQTQDWRLSTAGAQAAWRYGRGEGIETVDGVELQTWIDYLAIKDVPSPRYVLSAPAVANRLTDTGTGWSCSGGRFLLGAETLATLLTSGVDQTFYAVVDIPGTDAGSIFGAADSGVGTDSLEMRSSSPQGRPQVAVKPGPQATGTTNVSALSGVMSGRFEALTGDIDVAWNGVYEGSGTNLSAPTGIDTMYLGISRDSGSYVLPYSGAVREIFLCLGLHSDLVTSRTANSLRADHGV